MLSSSDIEAVEDVLFDPSWADQALDFFGLHGVVCASVIGPVDLTPESIFALATGQEEPERVPSDSFVQAVTTMARDMAQSLTMGQSVELPEPEDGDPMNALENWCAGFVETFLNHETDWLERDEEEVPERLVPILALSGLFEDEDFERVRENERLTQKMADAIPDAITDLYLLFHAPE
ncbi:uncharacterized protein C8D92_107140 [Tamilnaduibacter salinus]|uniref:YecA family protein n=1 Tax=Tamilnaduibacter salinus TaxID=1484056 RepID=A0A2A2I798_9GAMM|nr:YecA family protein [Tamilnaduibacter salinus]PAV27462.1 YecA family protein [Tamilnaduibacter salinus]PVY75419.1 uncharacterized protein C8D92_107140 [Tamilnaduibacter salinus]